MLQVGFELFAWIDSVPLPEEVKKKMKAEMEIAQKTAGEEFHTLIEESATSELDCLRAKDASFYNDDSRCSNFIYYLMCQFFRTLKMRNLVASFGTPVPGHDLRRTWVIESLIYATNVGFALYAERHRYKIIFLENQSAVPFITGDQPVINLRTHQINDMEIYYPLSPRLALVFTTEDSEYRTSDIALDPPAVESLNRRLFERSEDQVYSNDRDYLTSLTGAL